MISLQDILKLPANDINNRLDFIDNMNIGDTFSRDQLMAIFKISGQSGMMKTNLLNMLVLTTSESNGIYGDSIIENGTITYTGEGQIGDQTITKNNKTLFYSKDNGIPVYLFSKDKKRRYTFEGRVELSGEPYQHQEKDINDHMRKVWKFPLQVIYYDTNIPDNKIEKISSEILEIENNIEIVNSDNLLVDTSLLKIRKYRRRDLERKISRSKRPDYIAEEIIKTKQGEINEKIVFQRELEYLIQMQEDEHVELMKEFFENRKDNEGYDILSYEQDKDGNWVEKYIEVKSTKGPESTPIDITDNELEFAKNHIDQYYLYRIYNSESSNRTLKVVSGKELLENYSFIPSTFRIYSD